MDKITKSLLKTFIKEHSLESLGDTEAFERFANFCVVSEAYSETFALEDVSTGGGSDIALDGIGIIVNGLLVTSKEEIDDLCRLNRSLSAEFILIQAKTSTSFDGGEIGKFLFGAKDFFEEKPALPQNEFIKEARNLQEYIYSKSALMNKGNPALSLYYVTTGEWTDAPYLLSKINKEREALKKTGLFRDVLFIPIDAKRLQRMYKDTRNKVSVEISFPTAVVLPDISGIKESYLGVLSSTEYLKLICDDKGALRRSVFYDNVRDFQGSNEINSEIKNTVSGPLKDRFPVLNNGVTIVARTLNKVGNKFRIEDYQIVNGCQTSHVLYGERHSLDAGVNITVKLIVTDNEDVTNSIIKATNRQTPVKPEELQALSDFQKTLEDYYASFPKNERLYYERRSKQYSNEDAEKVRIISIPSQIRSFASMFLEQPHVVGRHYGQVLQMVGTRIFGDKHRPSPYYTSAFANYKLEGLLRNGGISSKYRPFRYQMLAIFRRQVAGAGLPSLSSSKIDAYCDCINKTLWEHAKAVKAFKDAAKIIDKAIGNTYSFDRDTAKNKTFTDVVLSLTSQKPTSVEASGTK